MAPDRLAQLLFLVVTTAVGVWAHGRWLSPMRDNGFSWSVAYRLGHGEVLYRDIYFPYGPLTPYLLAAAGRPFAFSCLWYVLANWVTAIAAGWLLLECGRRCLSVFANCALAILVLGFSLFVPGAGRLVLPYYAGVAQALVFALVAMLMLAAPPERLASRGLIAGVLAGLAFCCKPELGVATLAGLLAAAATGIPKAASWTARVIGGFGSVAVAGFLFVISCDSLPSLRSNSHLWPLNPVPPPQLVPIFRIASGVWNPQWFLVVRSAAFRMLLATGLFALAATLIAAERRRERWHLIPKPISWVVRVIGGLGSVAAAACLLMIYSGFLPSLQENSQVWPLSMVPAPRLAAVLRIASGPSSPQWLSVLRSPPFHVLFAVGLLTLAAMLTAGERSRQGRVPLAGLFAALAIWFGVEGVALLHPSNYVCLSMLVAFLVAALALVRRSTEGRPFLVGFGIFAGLAGSRAAFSCEVAGPYAGPAHLAESLTWAVFFSVFVPALLTGTGSGARWAHRLFPAAILVVAAFYTWLAIPAMRFPLRIPFETDRGRVYLGEGHVQFFGALGRELRPGESVLVLPEISAVDVIFGVHQDSPLENHLPGWLDVEVERALIARLDRRPPDAIVIFERPTGEFAVEPFGRGFGVLLADWCRRRYSVIAETPAGVILRPRHP